MWSMGVQCDQWVYNVINGCTMWSMGVQCDQWLYNVINVCTMWSMAVQSKKQLNKMKSDELQSKWTSWILNVDKLKKN